MGHCMSNFKKKSIIFTIGRYLYSLIPVFISCVAVLFFGKDVNSDTLNYHVYAAFGLLEGRISSDFFPAGPQSYLNPVGYIPFHFLRAWLPDLWIALSLAILNSAGIYAVIYITKEFIKKTDDFYTYYLTIVCSLLTTVFWQAVGSSFIDGYICALVLFGTLYFIRSFKLSSDKEQNKNLILSAGLLGIAAGLKLTSLLYCIAAGITLFLFLWATPKRWGKLVIFFSSGFMAFILIEGWWAYLVYERTGNPFFPYFNNVFESPFYPSQAISNNRFTPESWIDALLFPLYAVMPAPWLYQELRAPDIRFCVFFLLLILVVLFKWSKIKESTGGAAGLVFYLLSYALWLLTTGNGRYGIHLFLMLGAFIGWFSLLLCGKSVAKNILLFIVIVQSICLWLGAASRYSEQNFSDNWYEYEVPQELKEKPALLISLDVNSLSFLVQSLHEKSVFTNLSGQLVLPKTQELDSFLSASAQKVNGNVWVVSIATQDAFPVQLDALPSNPIVADSITQYLYTINTRLSRLSMSVDKNNCFYISPKGSVDFRITPLIVSCKVKPDDQVFESYKKQAVEYDLVFDKIEKSCPDFFNPKISFTENMGDLWGRKYLGSEVRLYVSMGSVWIDFSDRALPINLGSFVELQHSSTIINCNNNIPRMSHDAW